MIILTLAEFMRDAGYVTGQIGKWDIGCCWAGAPSAWFHGSGQRPAGHAVHTRHRGWTREAYLTDLNGDSMVEFVDRNAGHPFFLYFSPLAIHSKVKETPQRYKDRIPGGDGTAYEGAVVAVDDAVGKLLVALQRHGIEQETLILITGDNGANIDEGGTSEPYRGGKGKYTQQEGWVHTPTVITWPQKYLLARHIRD